MLVSVGAGVEIATHAPRARTGPGRPAGPREPAAQSPITLHVAMPRRAVPLPPEPRALEAEIRLDGRGLSLRLPGEGVFADPGTGAIAVAEAGGDAGLVLALMALVSSLNPVADGGETRLHAVITRRREG